MNTIVNSMGGERTQIEFECGCECEHRAERTSLTIVPLLVIRNRSVLYQPWSKND